MSGPLTGKACFVYHDQPGLHLAFRSIASLQKALVKQSRARPDNLPKDYTGSSTRPSGKTPANLLKEDLLAAQTFTNLFKKDQLETAVKDFVAKTILHLLLPAQKAATNELLESLKLDEYKIKPNAELVEAASRVDIKAVQKALDEGADVNWYDRKELMGTALGRVAGRGFVEIAKLLLERGANVNEAGIGYTPLGLASTSKKGKEMIKLLLDAGADVNKQSNGTPPLMDAIQFELTDNVKLLLAAGADPNAKPKNKDFYGYRGHSVLGLALANGFKEIVEMLKAKGARE